MKVTVVRKKTNKYVRLTVKKDGSVVVSAPKFFPIEEVQKFVVTRRGWIDEQIQKFAAMPKVEGAGTREHFKEHKQKSLAFLNDKVKNFAAMYGVQPSAVAVGVKKTQWGSCNREGRMRFNYMLYFLPEHLAEYIVVHEICHMVEFNHSPKFWEAVGKSVPDYKNRKRELKGFAGYLV